MNLNQKDMSDNKWERDRKLFIESFPGEKTFVSLPDKKGVRTKTNLLRSVSVNEDQYPIDGQIDFRTKIIPVKIIMGLEKLNELGAGIFMCINENNGTGRKDKDVIRIRSCMADFDNPDIPLPDFVIEPSMIVETSSKKYHVYWFSDSIPLEGFRQLQESIIFNYGSDVAVKNPGRPGRVPGFYHNKEKRFMSSIVHYTGNKYSFDLLTDSFPPEPKKQFSAPQYKTINYDNAEFKGSRGASDGGRNAHIIKRIGGMINRGLNYNEIEAEIYKEAESCSPPLDQFDINNLLKSAKKYL
jgi:hypothetical protein